MEDGKRCPSHVNTSSSVSSNIQTPLACPNAPVPGLHSPNYTPPQIPLFLVSLKISTPPSRNTLLSRAHLVRCPDELTSKRKNMQQETELKNTRGKRETNETKKEVSDRQRSDLKRTAQKNKGEEKAHKAQENAHNAQSKGTQEVNLLLV